jgi:hypothetical protein
MIVASAYVNHAYARRFPRSCPFIVVAEFPRSGANWTRDMLGDCLQLPVPRFSLFPISFPALVHSHSARPITGAPAVYVLRDGRDVLVSHFWKSVNGARSARAAVRRRVLQLHPSMRDLSPGQEAVSMEAFYEEWRRRPMGSRKNWGDHVTAWLGSGSPRLTVVRYEDLHLRPKEALATAVGQLSARAVEEYVIECAIARNAFERKSGRPSGVVDNASNLRSGKAGAWRAALPDPLKERFRADFGKALELAGYDAE